MRLTKATTADSLRLEDCELTKKKSNKKSESYASFGDSINLALRIIKVFFSTTKTENTLHCDEKEGLLIRKVLSKEVLSKESYKKRKKNYL